MKQKLQNLYLIAFLTLAAASIILLYHSNKKTITHQKKIVSSFINNVEYHSFNEQGKLSSIVTAKHVTHYKDEKDTFFTEPNILTYTTNGTPWKITAQQGKSDESTDRIVLWGHVSITELSQNKQPLTIIKTTELTLFPKESRATTDKHVTIHRQNSFIEGNGLVANLKKGMYELLSQSKGMYNP